MIITAKSYPRAALIGNPSDGYFGKTIAFVFGNFEAEVTMYQSPELQILPNIRDHSNFDGIAHLVEDVNMFGYYGGLRLLKATVKRFHDYCRENDLSLNDRNFTIRYRTDIPAQLGLAGSSAIITACLRALMMFYGIDIPKPILANIALSVEVDELGISAGLQDRVAQAYEQPVFMDFNQNHMEKHGYGVYRPIPVGKMPRLYIAYRANLAEGSEKFHSTLRSRYEQGSRRVLAAVEEWASLAEDIYRKLLAGEREGLDGIINRNFDLRREVCRVSDANIAMVETARMTGASAKFTGSGGAIIGVYHDGAMYDDMKRRFAEMGVDIIKPIIIGK